MHLFTSLERWKEEVLLLREELRRIGAWYQHWIQHAEDSLAADLNSLSRRQRFGWQTLIREKIYRLKADHAAAKAASHYVT